jgi:hypothetical protein
MRIVSLLSLLLLSAACRNTTASEPGSTPAPAQPVEHTAHPSSPHGAMPTNHPAMEAPAAPEGPELVWIDPTGWRRTQPSSAMRRAQYAVPGTAGAADAEVAVFYFGAGQGGSVADNISRWHGQFAAEPTTPAEPPVRQQMVHNLRVHLTERVGRFGGMQMPGAPAPAGRDNWAMLGAIVETPQGPWFFKMTGPRATVDAARPRFDELVASFRMP